MANNEGNFLDELVGPFYDMSGVASMLSLNVSEVLEKVACHDILCCTSADGILLFPTFQFTDQGEMVPAISRVIKVLASGVNAPWTWAMWLTSAMEDWGNLSAAQWLKENRDENVILNAARSDAHVWAN